MQIMFMSLCAQLCWNITFAYVLPSDLILLPGDNSLWYELLCIFLQDWFLLFNLFVHQWLCEHWLIHLIVAVPPVTYLQIRPCIRHRRCKCYFVITKITLELPKCSFLVGNSRNSVAYQVHHHVFMERCPPLSSNIAHIHHGVRVVGIDVEDGGINHPGHVSRVGRRASHTWVSGEANLMRQHKMVEGRNYSFMQESVKSLFTLEHFIYLDCILKRF